MKKHWLISVAMLALASTAAIAADDTQGAPPTGKHHQWTLDEARKKAHEKADKLDKMTEEEFAAQQGKKQAWRAKWKTMTPEEKAAYKQSRHSKRHAAQDSGAAPSSMAAPVTPAASAPMSAPAPVTPPMSPAPMSAAPAPMTTTPSSPLPSAPALQAAPTAPSSNVPPMEMTSPPMTPTSPSNR